MLTKTCANKLCRRTFNTTRHSKKYCSSKCRFMAWDAANPRITKSEITESLHKNNRTSYKK